jgi:Secretion system C-terminal sorting domain
MKKLYTLSLFLIAFTGFSQSIPFTGTGELSANGWVVTGTPTTPAVDFPGHLQILTTPSDNGSSLSYAGLPTSTGGRTTTTHNNTQDCNIAITSNTGIAYFSTLIKATNTTGMFSDINTTSGLPNNGEYFMHFAATAGTGAGTFVGRVYVKAGTTANKFKIAILNGATPSPGVTTPTYSTTEYNVAQTYFMVVKYDRAINTASLFINPTPDAIEPTATITNATGTTAAPTQVAALCIRQSGSVTAATSTGNVEIDEIRVGTTWTSVTSSTLAVKQNEIAGLSIHPNPVSNGVLYINTTANEIKNVIIIDVLGKQVCNTTISGNAINVSNLNSGVYIVKITENGKSNTLKVVIQ